MKALVGIDAASGLVHTVIGTGGNAADVNQAPALLHGDGTAALGDAGYQGAGKRPENIGKSVTWHVPMRRSKRKALPNNKLRRITEKLEHLRASVWAKVEHPFHVIKNLFRHRKTRYCGLAKNTAQLFTLFALANLILAGRRFTVTGSRNPSWLQKDAQHRVKLKENGLEHLAGDYLACQPRQRT